MTERDRVIMYSVARKNYTPRGMIRNDISIALQSNARRSNMQNNRVFKNYWQMHLTCSSKNI